MEWLSPELMKVMAGLGFPAWALVVAWGVMKVTAMFQALVDKLAVNHVDVEKRLVLLEEIAKRHDRIIDRLEERVHRDA